MQGVNVFPGITVTQVSSGTARPASSTALPDWAGFARCPTRLAGAIGNDPGENEPFWDSLKIYDKAKVLVGIPAEKTFYGAKAIGPQQSTLQSGHYWPNAQGS